MPKLAGISLLVSDLRRKVPESVVISLVAPEKQRS